MKAPVTVVPGSDTSGPVIVVPGSDTSGPVIVVPGSDTSGPVIVDSGSDPCGLCSNGLIVHHIDMDSVAKGQENQPPKIRFAANGEAETSSLADLLEWFLMYDERTARMRHTNTEELFQWKQKDDEQQGIGTYPFENAEARFAVGAFQALAENNSEPLLKLWISDLLEAIQESHKTKTEIAESYGLDQNLDASSVQRAEKLTTNAEKRLYLRSCWLEALCTAETRFLGWVYQEIYGRPFA